MLEKFKKQLREGLKKAKKAGPGVYKKARAEAKQKLGMIKADAKLANSKAREIMRNTIDKHHAAFSKKMKAAKAKWHSIKFKLHSQSKLMHMLSTHAAVFKKRYLVRKQKYKHSYKLIRHKMNQKIAKLKKSIQDEKQLHAALKVVKKKLATVKKVMKAKIAKSKVMYKAKKSEMKQELHKLAAKAAHFKEKVQKKGRKLLAEDKVEDKEEDFLAAKEMESDEEMRRHEAHHKSPAKCAKCHAACYKNCALQYFGPEILKNTVSSSMCLSTKNLNAIDTIKTAMDAVSHIDYLLGGQQGIQAFFILLPAALSFLSAVLKAAKLSKKVLPQSRLAGYLIVLAAISNMPILSAFIAMGYQAVGDVFFCLGCFSFLCTFLVFCLRTESLVKSQTHKEANEQIDGRAKLTFVCFGFAGIFLGYFLYEHQSVVRAALHLPLTMLIIKKVCDFLGRTMFTFVVMVDLIFSLFDKLYGGEHGDQLATQEFNIPLSQIKRLFEDRDSLIEKIEEEQ